MSETFGARLRRQRETQGVDLVAIAEQTKIKLSLLEGLERDDVSHWPAGIFRRAFLRAYARAIKLDEERTVAEFLEHHPEPCAPAIAPLTTSGDDAERANAGPHTRLRALVGSTFGSFARRRLPALDPVPPPAEMAPPPAMTTPPTEMTPPTVEQPVETVRDPEPAKPAVPPEPDLTTVADLCVQFGRVESATGVLRLLEKAAGILHATGLIVWVWDGSAAVLKPALAHGYPETVVARLPPVRPTANNATAAAFRSEEVREIDGDERTSGALAIPLMTPAGCAGILAIELERGSAPAAWVRAVATIFAAMLAQLVAVSEPAAEMRA